MNYKKSVRRTKQVGIIFVFLMLVMSLLTIPKIATHAQEEEEPIVNIRKIVLTFEYENNVKELDLPPVELSIMRRKATDANDEWELLEYQDSTGETQKAVFVTNKNIYREDGISFSTPRENEDGELYRFQVFHRFVNEDLRNDNWVYRSQPGHFNTIGQTGLIMEPKLRFVEGSEYLNNVLTIKKKLDNSGLLGETIVSRNPFQERLSFQLKLSGPYGYQETVDISLGDVLELYGLYYGEYTIEEILTEDNYDVTYKFEDGLELEGQSLLLRNRLLKSHRLKNLQLRKHQLKNLR